MGALYFLFVYDGGKRGLELENRAVTGQLDGKTEEELVQELNQKVEDGMFMIAINTKPYFPTGSSKGDLCIENSPANHYYMTVKIVENDTGELLYETKALEPNSHIQEDVLLKNLGSGEYPATATFEAYDQTTHQLIGSAGADMLIIVG